MNTITHGFSDYDSTLPKRPVELVNADGSTTTSKLRVLLPKDMPSPLRSPDVTVEDMHQRLDEERYGKIRHLRLHYPVLNKMLGHALRPGELTVLFGGAGTGKSFFSLPILLDAIDDAFTVKLMALEDTSELWVDRFIAVKENNWKIAALPSSDDPTTREEWGKMKAEAYEKHKDLMQLLLGDILYENPRRPIIRQDGTRCTFDLVYENIIACVEEIAEKVDLLVIDNVAQINFETVGGATLWNAQTDFVHRLAGAISGTKCHVILVSHTIKDMMHVQRVTAESLMGSAVFSRNAQALLALEHHAESKESVVYGKGICGGDGLIEHNFTLHVIKSRNAPSGAQIAYSRDNIKGPVIREEGMIKIFSNALSKNSCIANLKMEIAQDDDLRKNILGPTYIDMPTFSERNTHG